MTPRSGRYTYRQEIAALKRQVRELTLRLGMLRDGLVLPTRGVQVPNAPPEREATRQQLAAREAQLRSLQEEAIWKP